MMTSTEVPVIEPGPTVPSVVGATTETSGRELAFIRLTEIYTIYNPSKLVDLPGLLDKYKGHENDLVAAAEEKYCRQVLAKTFYYLQKYTFSILFS